MFFQRKPFFATVYPTAYLGTYLQSQGTKDEKNILGSPPTGGVPSVPFHRLDFQLPVIFFSFVLALP